MDYARRGRFITDPPRSLFVDGEIAMMLGARRLIREKDEYRAPLAERVEAMLDYMRRSPVLSGESYPDECWMFCNTTALAAIRIADLQDGTDHSDFIDSWLTVARKELVDERTGLLVSSYYLDGTHRDGPEGSSIWMAAHNLRILDDDFARDQYERAKRELGKGMLGFGWASEWPDSWRGPQDVDSGPEIPILRVSAGSSGLAVLGAAAFDDDDYLRSLLTTLNFAAFPIQRDGTLRFGASNQVGDAVLVYALSFGPLWERIKEESRP